MCSVVLYDDQNDHSKSCGGMSDYELKSKMYNSVDNDIPLKEFFNFQLIIHGVAIVALIVAHELCVIAAWIFFSIFCCFRF